MVDLRLALIQGFCAVRHHPALGLFTNLGVLDVKERVSCWLNSRHTSLAHGNSFLDVVPIYPLGGWCPLDERSEEHTSELQSLMRISHAIFCLQKKKNTNSYN